MCPVLKQTFAIDVTRDELALLCAGDKDTLEGLVEELYSRVPNASAVQGTKEDTANNLMLTLLQLRRPARDGGRMNLAATTSPLSVRFVCCLFVCCSNPSSDSFQL